MKKLLLIALCGIMAASCATQKTVTKADRYKALYDERPISILAMPPINKSTKVEAKELFYSSLIVPLSLQGYYVMPPLLTMEILKEESAYDAEMFENSSMKPVGELFGVDAVLFTTIHKWNKTTVASRITVTLEYTLKSAKTDEILFNRTGTVTYNPNSGSSGGGLAGLAVSMAAKMLTTALTNEIIVGRKCNVYTLQDLPAGKYSPKHGKDGTTPSGEPSFNVTVQ